MDFKDLFTHQQKILELELEVARTRFEHLGLRVMHSRSPPATSSKSTYPDP